MPQSRSSWIKRQQLAVAAIQAVGLFLLVLGIIDTSSALEVIGAVIFMIGVVAGIRVIIAARRSAISKAAP
jgi:hypothetical protein